MNTTATGSRAISFCLTLLSSITESLSWTHNGRFLWSMHSAAGSTCSIGHQQGTINANGAEHSWKTGRDLAVANCQPCVSGSIQFQTEGIDSSSVNMRRLCRECYCDEWRETIQCPRWCGVRVESPQYQKLLLCHNPTSGLFVFPLRVSLNPPGVHSRWRTGAKSDH